TAPTRSCATKARATTRRSPRAACGSWSTCSSASSARATCRRRPRPAPAKRATDADAARAALLRLLDAAAVLQPARDRPAQERPGEARGPAGEHVARVVHAEVDARDSGQETQERRDHQAVQLQRQ